MTSFSASSAHLLAVALYTPLTVRLLRPHRQETQLDMAHLGQSLGKCNWRGPCIHWYCFACSRFLSLSFCVYCNMSLVRIYTPQLSAQSVHASSFCLAVLSANSQLIQQLEVHVFTNTQKAVASGDLTTELWYIPLLTFQ